MKSRINARRASLLAFLAVLTLITAFYLSGVAGVPFHPDESTQMFTSGDVELFFQRPDNLFWRVENENDLRQLYRELDAPLTHFVIAAGRWFAGAAALPVDWDWSKTWLQNQQAGALPSAELLLASRFAVAALFPFSVLFLFLTVRRVTNEFTAWAAALLLASNALVLLHTRRAMAEGGLLFTLTLSIWALVKAEKRPWLVAIPAALAFCAKQTLAAFAPIGFLAVLWPVGNFAKEQPKQWIFQIARQSLLYDVIFIAIVFLMNPVFWAQPIPAIKAAIQARQELARRQSADSINQGLNTPGRKIIGLIGGAYLTPPIFAEAGNYKVETHAAETAYLANPMNALFRSIPAGAGLMIIGLFGFTLCGLRMLSPGSPNRRRLVLLVAASLLQTLALLVLIPLAWQRYYLPVVPYACLWTAYGLDQLKELVLHARVKRVAPVP
jgi:hypothetical protein